MPENVVKSAGSAKALEVMYGRYRRNLFSRGFLPGLSDFFWHHCVSQPKGLRNRLKIVENSLEEEIARLLEEKKDSRQIRFLTIGGGSARGITEVLHKYSKQLNGWEISAVNVDKSLESIELGKELAKEFGLFDKFTWIEGLAQNVDSFAPENSADIVEMVGLLDYFSDEKSVEVFRQVYKILSPGGIFLVGNVVTNPEQKFIKSLGWPDMYYRTADNLAELLVKAGFLEEQGKIIFEPLKNHIVARVQKPDKVTIE